MKASFETLAAIIVFVMNAAGLATLIGLLNKTEIKDLAAELRPTVMSEHGYIRRKRDKFAKMIFSPYIILFHLLNLAVLCALILALVFGPDKLLAGHSPASVAQPLTPLEEWIFLFWLIVSFLGYIVQCASPSVQNVILLIRASLWLRKNDPHRQAYRRA